MAGKLINPFFAGRIRTMRINCADSAPSQRGDFMSPRKGCNTMIQEGKSCKKRQEIRFVVPNPANSLAHWVALSDPTALN